MTILNDLSGEYGFKPLDKKDLNTAKDMSARQFISHLEVPRLKVPRILAEGKKRLRTQIGKVTPCTGMVELVKAARDEYEIIGILTSNSQENVDIFLKNHNLEVFDFISTIPKLSGKAKNLKAIMRTFNLVPEETFFVGDELRDIKAGKKAGVPTAAVTWGFNSEKSLREAEPTYVVSDTTMLLEILKHAHDED